MHRRMIRAAVVLLVVLGAASPASADGTGDAFNDGDEIGAGAQDGTSGGGGRGGGGGGTSRCRYELMDQAGQDAAQGLADGGWGQQPGGGEGAFYRRICDIGNGQTSASIVWLPTPSPAVDPAVLAQQALDRTPIPAPALRLNPPAGQEQVVNVPTWMWLDASAWQPVSASASAGGVTVTATASPTSVRWSMGNGDTVTCAGPGVPYDPSRPSSEQQSDCTYTYRRSSAGSPDGAFTLTVTTTWAASWTVTGAPGGGSLGTASRTSTSTVRVAEIQAVNE